MHVKTAASIIPLQSQFTHLPIGIVQRYVITFLVIAGTRGVRSEFVIHNGISRSDRIESHVRALAKDLNIAPCLISRCRKLPGPCIA